MENILTNSALPYYPPLLEKKPKKKRLVLYRETVKVPKVSTVQKSKLFCALDRSMKLAQETKTTQILIVCVNPNGTILFSESSRMQKI